MDISKSKRIVFLLFPLLMGVGLPRCEWQGPSDYFNFIDKNSDGNLSLNEWMNIYNQHQHDWLNCRGSDFQRADCDADHQLTWHEYYALRFQGKSCANSKNMHLLKRPVFQAAIGTWSFSDF